MAMDNHYYINLFKLALPGPSGNCFIRSEIFHPGIVFIVNDSDDCCSAKILGVFFTL